MMYLLRSYLSLVVHKRQRRLLLACHRSTWHVGCQHKRPDAVPLKQTPDRIACSTTGWTSVIACKYPLTPTCHSANGHVQRMWRQCCQRRALCCSRAPGILQLAVRQQLPNVKWQRLEHEGQETRVQGAYTATAGACGHVGEHVALQHADLRLVLEPGVYAGACGSKSVCRSCQASHTW